MDKKRAITKKKNGKWKRGKTNEMRTIYSLLV